MSWKMNAELRQKRLAGQLPGLDSTTFLVLFVMADTCRGDSRDASIGVTEVVNLTGLDRTTVWRAVKKLGALGYVIKHGRSNQYQAARYEVLPGARCTDAPCSEEGARCTDAPCSEEGARCTDAPCNDEVHVAPTEVHVANKASARCTDATVPVTPDINPDTPSLSLGGARKRARTRDKLAPPTREQQGLHPLPASQWDEPPEFCPLHPDDTTEPCLPCKIQRRELKRWFDTYDERVEQYWHDHPEAARKQEEAQAEARRVREAENEAFWAKQGFGR